MPQSSRRCRFWERGRSWVQISCYARYRARSVNGRIQTASSPLGMRIPALVYLGGEQHRIVICGRLRFACKILPFSPLFKLLRRGIQILDARVRHLQVMRRCRGAVTRDCRSSWKDLEVAMKFTVPLNWTRGQRSRFVYCEMSLEVAWHTGDRGWGECSSVIPSHGCPVDPFVSELASGWAKVRGGNLEQEGTESGNTSTEKVILCVVLKFWATVWAFRSSEHSAAILSAAMPRHSHSHSPMISVWLRQNILQSVDLPKT